jgi:hypothetical protein
MGIQKLRIEVEPPAAILIFRNSRRDAAASMLANAGAIERGGIV